MAMTVTATQGGSTANGMILRVYVITGAAAVASQNGGALNLGFASNTNAWTGSVTTTAGSNFYGGASMSGSGNSPTGTLVTIVDTTSDTTNAETYVTFHGTNITGGANTRGIQASPAAAGCLAGFEIKASGTLAEDGSAPALASTTTATSVTTASFTPPAGSLLVAIAVTDGGASATTCSITDNSAGGPLNWTQKTSNPAAGEDFAGVFIADVPAGGAAAPTVSAALPGRTWLRRFHHAQFAAPSFTAAAAPVSGPPVYPLTGPVGLAQRLPPPTSGSAGGSPGLFAQQGPPVTPLDGPVRARQPLPPRGRTRGNPGTRQQTGPPVTPLDGPVRARFPLPRRGRCGGSQGSFTQVAIQSGPPVYPLRGPVRAVRPSQLPGGRCRGNPGTYTAVVINNGPPVYPLRGPVRTRPQPPPRGRCAGSRGTRAQTGAPVTPLRGPVAPFRPGPFRSGRTQSDPGTRSQTGSPVYPLHSPVRSRVPQRPRGGHCAGNAGTYTFIPPPPFTIGTLTAADAALGVLTAATAAGGTGGGVLTATDQRTGGPS